MHNEFDSFGLYKICHLLAAFGFWPPTCPTGRPRRSGQSDPQGHCQSLSPSRGCWEFVASMEIIYHDENTHLEKPTLQHSRALLQNTPGFWSILYGTFCDSTDQEAKFQSPNEPKHSSTHCLDKKNLNQCMSINLFRS